MSIGNDSNEFPPGEGGAAAGEGAPEASLNTGRPAVASAPGKMAFILLFVAIFIIILARSLFFTKTEDNKPPPPPRKEHVAAAANGGGGSDLTIAPGSLPAPPSVELTPSTPPPPPPPPPPAILTPPSPDIHANAPTNEALNRRIHSPMLAMAGRVTPSSQANAHGPAIIGGNDPNTAFAQNVSVSSAGTTKATKIANLNITIAQGKLVHAVLESAIDSDLPGAIRAIVSHDVYAEAGRGVLIPKGSRLIGTYNAAVRRGQVRVFIIWSRVIRPDGVDIAIDSPSIDTLGRAGLSGDVDNKYFEMFSSAIMTSSLDIGVAALGDALFGNQQTTTVNNGSGTTTTESPTAAAMQEAVQNISNVGASIVNNALNLSPTIYIDQGTQIEVFVNRDLTFPYDITGHSGFIQ